MNTKKPLEEIESILSLELDPAFARRAKLIFENLLLKGEEKVLEVGCGRGFYLKTLARVWPKLTVTGLDCNEKYLKLAKGYLKDLPVNLVLGDATKLPFEDNSFDRVIASEILEHLPDDQKAIAEIYRVLKPGGAAMITVPNENYPFFWDPLNWTLEKLFKIHVPANVWWLAGLWADHVRLYSVEGLEKRLKKVGFKLKKTWRATHYCLPFSHFLLYGIGKNLVEKGLAKSCNRFSGEESSCLGNIISWPLRLFDKSNQGSRSPASSVNIVVLAIK